MQISWLPPKYLVPLVLGVAFAGGLCAFAAGVEVGAQHGATAAALGALALALLGAAVLVVARWQRAGERQRARAQEQELSYRRVFREMPLPLGVVDDDSDGLLAVNDALCALYGYGYGELLDLRFAELDAGATPDGRARFHRRRDGSLIPVALSSQAQRFGGRRVHLQQVRDLSAEYAAAAALFASEARLRLYLERMPVACLVLDREVRIQALNPAGERIFGVVEADVVGHPLFETPLGTAGQHLRFMLGRLREGVNEIHGITEMRTPDGRDLVAEWFCSPLPDAAGKYQGCLGMVMDVSAQMSDRLRLARTHQELADLSARLLHLQEQERRSLARELHDEIGQQLAALRIQLVALRRSLGEQPAEVERTEDCIDIVESTLAHIRDRAMTLRPAVLDDLGLVPALKWFAQLQSARAGVPIRLDLPAPRRYPEALEITVFRLVQEAVTNALKHAQARRIDVCVRECGSSLNLVVEDDGCGFTPDQQAPGRCMGLAGMRERAALTGGHLQVESRPGQGTRIAVTLPLAASAPAAETERS